MSDRTGRFTTISVRPEVRDELRALKRGQESYSELLMRMKAQFDPNTNQVDTHRE